MARFPQLPERLREPLEQYVPGFYAWITDISKFFWKEFATDADITVNAAGKGIVLTNTGGTVTKRVRLNDVGDGIVFEDVT